MNKNLIVSMSMILACSSGLANTIQLDTSTALLDGSSFTNGQQYYAAWQLTGGSVSDSDVTVQNLDLGGGLPVAPGAGDLTAGLYQVTTGANAANGIFGGSLNLQVIPANSYSLYSQQFIAGTQFQFDYFFGGNFTGVQPDEFTFQLYDPAFNSLLYEQAIDVRAIPAATVPEPANLALLGAAGLAMIILRRRCSASRSLHFGGSRSGPKYEMPANRQSRRNAGLSEVFSGKWLTPGKNGTTGWLGQRLN